MAKLAITMGDPCGVGPEIALKSFIEGNVKSEYVVFGDSSVMKFCAETLRLDVPINKVDTNFNTKNDCLNIFDCNLLRKEDIKIGQIDKKCGFAASEYVRIASEFALAGKFKAIVTLPINKEAIQLSTNGFSGHTGYIASITGTKNYTMMLASDKLIVTHVSTHVSLLDAINNLSIDRVVDVIELTSKAVQHFFKSPKIAVAGLNPHAGENGSFGKEEIHIIEPAIKKANERGVEVEGPVPPDTVFYRALKGQFDAVVCMYHDQGHIPMKVLDFEGGVNITLGLPFIRTSVDHGTAFDIAYKGIAKTRSLNEAIRMVTRLL